MSNRTRPVILTLLALVAAARLAAAAGAAPKVVIPAPVWNAGHVARGERLATDFVIRNEGDAVLELLEVKPACGCTVASFDAKIAPGGEGKVHAELDTTGFLGAIAKGITVLTNDPANPRLQLTIQAEVESRMRATPGYARYIYVQGHGEAPIGQTVWATDFPDLEIREVVSPYPFLTTSFREAAADERSPDTTGRQWRVITTCSPTPRSAPSPGRSSSAPTTRGSRSSRSRSPASCARSSPPPRRRSTSVRSRSTRRSGSASRW